MITTNNVPTDNVGTALSKKHDILAEYYSCFRQVATEVLQIAGRAMGTENPQLMKHAANSSQIKAKTNLTDERLTALKKQAGIEQQLKNIEDDSQFVDVEEDLLSVNKH